MATITLFSNKNFLKLFTSQMLSQVTLSVANFILINRVFTVTKSAIAVSLLWVFWGLPAVLIAPISGFFIDKWDKRKILIITNFCQALTVAAFLLVQDKSYHFLYILIFSYSLLNQFYLPTESASLPWLTKPEHLPRANALFLLTTYAAFIFGFGAGGMLIGTIGEKVTVTILAILLLIAAMAVAYLPRENKPTKLGANLLDFLSEEFHDAWDFITQKGILIVYALTFTAVLQIIMVTLIVVLPKIGHDILHRDFFQISTVLAGSLGLGIAAGSLIFPKVANNKRKKSWIIAGFIVLALSMLSFSFVDLFNPSRRVFLVSAALFTGGLAGTFILIPSQTFVQEHTPAKMRGKIFGLATSIVTLSAIAPSIFVAGFVEALGITRFLVAAGLCIVAIPLLLKKYGDKLINGTF